MKVELGSSIRDRLVYNRDIQLYDQLDNQLNNQLYNPNLCEKLRKKLYRLYQLHGWISTELNINLIYSTKKDLIP